MLIPYENFFIGTSDRDKNLSKALEVLDQGWRIGSYPAIKIDEKIDWSLKNETYRSWNFHLHSLDMLDRLLIAYNDYKLTFLLKSAVNVLLDWVSNNIAINMPEKISPYVWYDMAVGLRAYRIAYIFDAASEINLLNDNDKKVIWDALLLHHDYLALDSNIAYHSNHGYFQVVGQMAMGRRFKSMDCSYTQGVERFLKMMNQQFTQEGVHKEHSPEYHRMVYFTLKGVVDSGLIKDEKVLQFSRVIERALSWFIYPNQKIVNFGDSDDYDFSLSTEEAKKKMVNS